MKKQPYESPKLELQWLLSEGICTLSLGNGYDPDIGFGDDDWAEMLP